MSLLNKKIYIIDKNKELVFKQIFLSATTLCFVLIFLSSLVFPTPFRLYFEKLYGSFQHPNKLVVRNSALTFTLTDEAKVRRLYEEIYALPTFPYRGFFPYRGPFSCPSESRPTYNLEYYLNNSLISHGEYLPFGCGVSVKLDGIITRNDTGNSYGNDLVQALGISSDVFYGYHKPVYSQPLETPMYLSKFGFSPDKVTIKVGNAVRWENISGNTQILNSDDNAIDQVLKKYNTGVLASGASLTYIFSQPLGIYSFHTQSHPDQKGTVIVTK